MLVLGRRVGESIMIGDNIVITVTRLIGNTVGIGIDAPADVNIKRSELTKDESYARNRNPGKS